MAAAAIFYLIHLHDEVPRLGSGRRLVIVDTVGHKWVKLVNPTNMERVRIKRKTWNALASRAVEHQPSATVIKRNLKRHVGRDAPQTRKDLRTRIEAAL